MLILTSDATLRAHARLLRTIFLEFMLMVILYKKRSTRLRKTASSGMRDRFITGLWESMFLRCGPVRRSAHTGKSRDIAVERDLHNVAGTAVDPYRQEL